MSDIHFICPHCSEVVEVPEALLGKMIPCPHCGEEVRLKAEEELAGQRELTDAPEQEMMPLADSPPPLYDPFDSQQAADADEAEPPYSPNPQQPAFSPAYPFPQASYAKQVPSTPTEHEHSENPRKSLSRKVVGSSFLAIIFTGLISIWLVYETDERWAGLSDTEKLWLPLAIPTLIMGAVLITHLFLRATAIFFSDAVRLGALLTVGLVIILTGSAYQRSRFNQYLLKQTVSTVNKRLRVQLSDPPKAKANATIWSKSIDNRQFIAQLAWQNGDTFEVVVQHKGTEILEVKHIMVSAFHKRVPDLIMEYLRANVPVDTATRCMQAHLELTDMPLRFIGTALLSDDREVKFIALLENGNIQIELMPESRVSLLALPAVKKLFADIYLYNQTCVDVKIEHPLNRRGQYRARAMMDDGSSRPVLIALSGKVAKAHLPMNNAIKHQVQSLLLKSNGPARTIETIEMGEKIRPGQWTARVILTTKDPLDILVTQQGLDFSVIDGGFSAFSPSEAWSVLLPDSFKAKRQVQAGRSLFYSDALKIDLMIETGAKADFAKTFAQRARAIARPLKPHLAPIGKLALIPQSLQTTAHLTAQYVTASKNKAAFCALSFEKEEKTLAIYLFSRTCGSTVEQIATIMANNVR